MYTTPTKQYSCRPWNSCETYSGCIFPPSPTRSDPVTRALEHNLIFHSQTSAPLTCINSEPTPRKEDGWCRSKNCKSIFHSQFCVVKHCALSENLKLSTRLSLFCVLFRIFTRSIWSLLWFLFLWQARFDSTGLFTSVTFHSKTC